MKSIRSGDGDGAGFVDAKPYVEHDPLIGYRYIPNAQQVLPRPGGGHYELTINGAGVRSSREYSPAKPPGVFRILVFGDSFAAGQYVSNDQRFSEILERRVPGLEVMNFALEGTGTDQQLLIFEKKASAYEYDLVLLLPFLQNIRRNVAEARVSFDPKTLAQVLAPKPRFELVNGRLELRNVPVPLDRPVLADAGKAALESTDSDLSVSRKIKNRLNELPWIGSVKKAIYSLAPWEPFPEYKREDTREWQLMAAILRRFKKAAGEKPLVIVPVFYVSYVCYRMARNYWFRFSALEETPGIRVLDLLPQLKALGAEASRCFQEPYDCHFSAYGNIVLADFVERELRRIDLLPTRRDG